MPMTEGNIMRAIQMAACKLPGVRLFRQNVGQAWAGERVRTAAGQVITLRAGDVLLRKARPLSAGLCKGSSDLIGWRAVEVTEDMVGQRLALFAAVEVKTARGRVSDHQQRFIDVVRQHGGVAGVARSEAEALELLKE